ncbi:hypothetical protein [Novosphingobium sp. ZW T3_23]
MKLLGYHANEHRPSIKVCRQFGIAVDLFEEGYIRPGWVVGKALLTE